METRQERELAVYQMLDRLGIGWQRWDHPAVATIEDCWEIGRRMGVPMCKNLFLCNRTHTEFYLLMMPGEKQFKTKEVSKQIPTSRLSFAEAEYMEQYLHISPGAVSVMGLMNDTGHHVKLLIDEPLLADEYLGCHPCVNTSSIKVKMQDVISIFLPATGHDYQVVHL